ncbi:MAG: cation:proton antiporter [Thermoprotei archaeon]
MDGMGTDSILFQLGILVGFSGLFAYILKKIRMPSIIGYIVGGIILGPLTGIINPKSDFISFMAELGIILIIFEIGVSIKVKFLRREVLSVSSILITELIVVILLSYLAGLIINLSWANTVILALIAINTSTAMSFKIMEETGISKKYPNEVRTLLGVATLEDLLAIISLAILPALLSTHEILIYDLFKIILRVIIVMIAVIGLGLIFVKQFIDKLYIFSEELVLLIGLATAMIFSWLGAELELSDTLGAFIGGLIFAETKIGEEFITKGKWMRDLFAFMFFSSIGLMFPVNVNLELVIIGVLISIIIVFIKFIAFSFAFWSNGITTLENAINFGFYMITISEFSVIISNKGVALGIIGNEMLVVSIIVMIISSLISSILTAYSSTITPKLISIIPKAFVQNLEYIFNILRRTSASSKYQSKNVRKIITDLIIYASLIFIASTLTISALSYLITLSISSFLLYLTIYLVIAGFLTFMISALSLLRKDIENIMTEIFNELHIKITRSLSRTLINMIYTIIVLIIILFILTQIYFMVLKVFESILSISIVFRAYAALTIVLIVIMLYRYVKKFIITFQNIIKGA